MNPAESECVNCGWPIGEETRHEKTGQETGDIGVCNVIDTRNDRLIGWKRRREPVKKMYR